MDKKKGTAVLEPLILDGSRKAVYIHQGSCENKPIATDKGGMEVVQKGLGYLSGKDVSLLMTSTGCWREQGATLTFARKVIPIIAVELSRVACQLFLCAGSSPLELAKPPCVSVCRCDLALLFCNVNFRLFIHLIRFRAIWLCRLQFQELETNSSKQIPPLSGFNL